MIEASDLVFAMDSIPAVLAISNDPFIVFSSNVFAILGLRALFFFGERLSFALPDLAVRVGGCSRLHRSENAYLRCVSYSDFDFSRGGGRRASLVDGGLAFVEERGMMNKTVAFHTFGCKVNQYETEELREQLRLGGYQIVPMADGADVNVVNSCTVTAYADSSCRQLVRKILLEHSESRVVVTGCYAERSADELRECRRAWKSLAIMKNR